MNENKLFDEHIETPEEILAPPRIDVIGIFLMSLTSIVVGGCISLGILVSSFFTIGKFSLESGVSPMFLAMATLVSLVIGGSLYIVFAKSIFPSLYTRTRELLKHMMLYMLVLYIFLLPMYLLSASIIRGNSLSVLVPYLIHILLAIFGLEIILGVISQYRYVLLSLYANIAAMILSGGIVFLLFAKTDTSGASLFVLMGLSVLAFFLSTTLICVIKFLYYKFYTITGNDPLGSVFYNIEKEEYQNIEQAKYSLFHK